MAAKKRNPEIELWRFIFTVIIFIFHSNHLDDRICLLQQGFTAVEFFFITSGYFMALSAEKKYADSPKGLGTVQFLKGKIAVFYPYVVLTFLISYCVIEFTSKVPLRQMVGNFFLSFQDLGLFKMAGIIGVKYFNGPSWYLSAMILAMLVTFPLLLKLKDTFIYVVSPAVTLVIYAYLSHENGSLNVNTQWQIFTSLGFLRAVAGICAGCLCYGFVKLIKERKTELTRLGKVSLGALELIILAALIYIMQNRIVFKNSTSYDYFMVFLIFMLAVIVFSDITGISKLLPSKICAFLGEISLPFYLISHQVIDLYLGLGLHWRIRYTLIFYAVGSALGALVLYFIVKLCKKYKLGTKFLRLFVKN